jgi:hypothetical protein
MVVARALLHLESELGPGAHVDEFSAWCDQHHAEILAVPGFLCARRFVQLSPDTSATRLLTLYDLVDAAVLDGDAYAAHGRNHTPLPDDLAAALTFTRSVWKALSPHHRTAAGDALVWELSDADAATDLRTPYPDVDEAVLAGVRRFVPVKQGFDRITLTLIEARSVDDVAATARVPATGPVGKRRIYRQVFHSVA